MCCDCSTGLIGSGKSMDLDGFKYMRRSRHAEWVFFTGGNNVHLTQGIIRRFWALNCSICSSVQTSIERSIHLLRPYSRGLLRMRRFIGGIERDQIGLRRGTGIQLSFMLKPSKGDNTTGWLGLKIGTGVGERGIKL